MKKVVVVIFCAVLLCSISLTAIGCKKEVAKEEESAVQDTDQASETVSETKETTVVAEETERYVYVTNLASHPYWTPVKNGAQAAADELGAKFEYNGPSDWDALKQADMVNQISITKPTGMLVGAYDASMTAAINAAWENGVPVITVDSDAPDSNRLCFIGFDPPGRAYGEYISNLLGSKGKIGVLTVPAATNLAIKFDDMKKYFEENAPDIEIVAIEDTTGDDQVTADKTKAMVIANPDLNGLVCLDATGSGIAVALKELGKAGKIKVVVDSVSDPLLQGILDGAIDATTIMPIYLGGYYGIKLLHDYVNKLPNPAGADVGVPRIPKSINLGYFFINKDNAESFFGTG